MRGLLFPEWLWVADIEDPDRGVGSNEATSDADRTDQPDHPRTANESPSARLDDSLGNTCRNDDEWTVIPNHCLKDCTCKYCVEESQCGQESH